MYIDKHMIIAYKNCLISTKSLLRIIRGSLNLIILVKFTVSILQNNNLVLMEWLLYK